MTTAFTPGTPPRQSRPLPPAVMASMPVLRPRTRILIVQHPSETRHPLNTARLALAGLAGSRLLVGETFDRGDWHLPGYRDLLLFPPDQAAAPSANADTDGRPLQLIVPDGTWRKTRKLLYLDPELASLPRMSLPAGLTSRYRLRKTDISGAVSTVEAIVHALNGLDEPQCFDALLRPFATLIDLQIAAMGPAVYARNYAPEDSFLDRPEKILQSEIN